MYELFELYPRPGHSDTGSLAKDSIFEKSEELNEPFPKINTLRSVQFGPVPLVERTLYYVITNSIS